MQGKDSVMADWFKMYDNGLDEPRMKYAISKNYNVIAVWVWILSECCRNKSDHFDFNHFVTFGASQTIGLSQTDFEDALDVLDEIGYLSNKDGVIIVPKWDDRQSDYCKKKSKKTEYGHSTDNVPLDKKRVDKKRQEYSNGFLSFWELYPKKTGKGGAYKFWQKHKCESIAETIMASVNRHLQCEQWQKDGGQFVPNPATWLNQSRWEDSPDVKKTKKGGDRWRSM